MIFVQPTSIIELAAALAEKEGKTILAAGCTDILPGKIGRPWDADRIIEAFRLTPADREEKEYRWGV